MTRNKTLWTVLLVVAAFLAVAWLATATPAGQAGWQMMGGGPGAGMGAGHAGGMMGDHGAMHAQCQNEMAEHQAGNPNQTHGGAENRAAGLPLALPLDV